MSELINYNPDLIQRKIGVRESFEIKCTYLVFKLVFFLLKCILFQLILLFLHLLLTFIYFLVKIQAGND
jgi:hypothetical protein